MATGTAKQVSAMLKQGFISDPSFTCSSPTKSPVSAAGGVNLIQNSDQVHSASSPGSSASPTLYEMMSEEQKLEARGQEEARRRVSDRIARVLGAARFLKREGRGGGEVKLSVVSRDGFRVSMEVDRAVLVEKSRFFGEKLGGRNGGCGSGKVLSHKVEICDCDDVEVYVEVVVLMHCEDLKTRLLGEDVSKVLGLLKVSAAIIFDEGVVSCLEYLEAVPWTEEEEEKILFQVSQLRYSELVGDVLKRVVPNEVSTSARVDGIVSRLITGVLQSKDDKARREMKNLLSKLLKEDTSSGQNRLDLSKDALYHLCHRCLSSLILCLSEATSPDEGRPDRATLMVMGDIATEADNIQWIVDILMDRKMGDEFVKLWADHKDLATLHSKIPVMYRHEISRITAHLCIAIGRGRVLVPKEVRSSLLLTWLEALYEDFKWMRRTPKSVDKNLVEHGLVQTILTLPLQQQQSIFLTWFDRYLDKGDDYPNIQRGFEIWWRRSFIRQCPLDHEKSKLQIVVSDYPT